MARAENETPTVRSCATMEVHERLLRSDPEYAAARARSETQAWQYARGARAGGRIGVTVIPVVVHVVWRTNDQNVSDAQIASQIAVLNRDFRKTNADVSATPAVFAPLCADARIEFELATTDPNGNPTNGIVRVKTTTNGFTDNNAVKANSTGGADAWPSGEYLNLWVCRLAGGLLGYAQFPGGPVATDGVVIRDTSFGNTGTAAAPFGLGRTTTHEIGHWLNLRHIWGDDGNGCNGDDFVADTPNCAGANTGMPTFPNVTCNNGPNGDLFVNYMDYTDDAGMVMFTGGQVNRMQACLDTDRASTGHTKPGPTLALADIKPTLARIDLKPTVAMVDMNPTLAAVDVKPTLARADVKPTLARFDITPTLAQVDVLPTLAHLDSPATLAQFDVPGGGPTIAVLDQGGATIAGADLGGGTLGAADLPQGPQLPEEVVTGPLPFILATPHHTNAWIESHRALREQEVESLAAQAQEMEQALTQYAEADAAGRLSATEAATADQVYAEYQRVMEELDELGAFDG